MTIEADFAILCMQRSGSHLLAGAIASHPNVRFIGELEDLVRKSRTVVLDATRRNLVVVMYNQVQYAAGAGFDLRSLPVIHLTRENREVAISNIRNNLSRRQRGAEHRAHFTDPAQIPVQYSYDPDEEEIAAWQRKIENHRVSAMKHIEGNERILTIDYREITGGQSVKEIPQAIAVRICGFFGLPPHPLTSDLIKSSSALLVAAGLA